jgi:hypothetical protein
MITDIPTAEEFQAAGLNQIYLAWQIIIQTCHDFEQVTELAPSYIEATETDAAAAAYWQKSQAVLANALGLIQQAMEMSLKGRIAAISPYLLIARDPKEWPGKVDTQAVAFSEFRTLDAADLVKVHNTFSSAPFNDEFKGFWDSVRRDRNKLMHSVAAKTFDASSLVRTILIAIEALFSDVRWPQRLWDMEADGKYAAYGIGGDYEQNIVMGQVDTAMKVLTPGEKKRFFGFDTKRRSYVCPRCWQAANRDWQDDWPELAQLTSKTRGCTTLHCVICVDASEVERMPCKYSKCKSDVIFENRCMSCMSEQDQPYTFSSGLKDEKREFGNQYSLRYQSGTSGSYCNDYFPSEEAAVEHSRLSMEAPHLQDWESVTVTHGMGRPNKVIGTWMRTKKGLRWKPKYWVPVLGPKRRRRGLI